MAPLERCTLQPPDAEGEMHSAHPAHTHPTPGRAISFSRNQSTSAPAEGSSAVGN